MTEPATHTLKVPGATLTYDVRESDPPGGPGSRPTKKKGVRSFDRTPRVLPGEAAPRGRRSPR